MNIIEELVLRLTPITVILKFSFHPVYSRDKTFSLIMGAKHALYALYHLVLNTIFFCEVFCYFCVAIRK